MGLSGHVINLIDRIDQCNVMMQQTLTDYAVSIWATVHSHSHERIRKVQLHAVIAIAGMARSIPVTALLEEV